MTLIDACKKYGFDRDEIEERAAIFEYDGGYPRIIAEQLAIEIFIRNNKKIRKNID